MIRRQRQFRQEQQHDQRQGYNRRARREGHGDSVTIERYRGVMRFGGGGGELFHAGFGQ